jgi:hypothetical protein
MATWAKEQQNMYSLRSGAKDRMRLNYVHADYVKQQRLNTQKKQPTVAEKKLIPNGAW